MLFIAGFLLSSPHLRAAEENPAADLAVKLQNPVADLVSVQFLNNSRTIPAPSTPPSTAADPDLATAPRPPAGTLSGPEPVPPSSSANA